MDLLLAAALTLAALDGRAPEVRRTRGDEQNPKEGPTTAWKADLRLTLEKLGRDWVFVLRGTTTAPAEVKLRGRIFAVEIVELPGRGRREDEEPLLWEDDGEPPAFQVIEPGPGRFRVELGRFARKPWPILYRAKLQYRPRDQSEEVRDRFGEDDWTLYTDLRVGTAADFAAMLRSCLEEAKRDLLTLDSLYRELRRRFDEERGRPDLAAWNGWKEAWTARIEELDARNKLRYGLWAVYGERQAKLRIGGLCELSRRIVRACGEQFAAEKPDYTRIVEMIGSWREYFEEGADRIGIHPPLDPELFGPLLRDYEGSFAPLRAALVEPMDEDERAAARRGCVAALLRMVPLLSHRKCAYPVVNEVCMRLNRFLELAGASDREAIPKALEAHDLALQRLLRLAADP